MIAENYFRYKLIKIFLQKYVTKQNKKISVSNYLQKQLSLSIKNQHMKKI